MRCDECALTYLYNTKPKLQTGTIIFFSRKHNTTYIYICLFQTLGPYKSMNVHNIYLKKIKKKSNKNSEFKTSVTYP